MKIITCNIRCYGGNDGEDHWVHRKEFCVEVIRSRHPDIICLQEVWQEQFADLVPAFAEFSSFGIVDEPLGRHPVNIIFYRTDVFNCLSQGGYWLSETPHVTGSSSWDSACVRLANWVRLRHEQSGREFRIVNTHLDHVSQLARENQARVIGEDAAAYPPEYLQLLTGDMNCDAGNQAIRIFTEGGWRDSYEAIHGSADPGFTYHGFKGPAFESHTGKMDWIFVRGDANIAAADIVTDSRNGHFPSDHYFITAEVEL